MDERTRHEEFASLATEQRNPRTTDLDRLEVGPLLELISDEDRAVHDGPRTLHSVREDAFNYVWDNALEPALEVEPGAAVELHVRDASDEQIGPDSGVEAVSALDFEHVNPVSGPVFVKGARPGDVLEIELLELRPRDWGWTALIPGFGLLADEFPEPWLRISRVDTESGRVRFPKITE